MGSAGCSFYCDIVVFFSLFDTEREDSIRSIPVTTFLFYFMSPSTQKCVLLIVNVLWGDIVLIVQENVCIFRDLNIILRTLTRLNFSLWKNISDSNYYFKISIFILLKYLSLFLFPFSPVLLSNCVNIQQYKILGLPLWTNSSCPWSMWACVKLSTGFIGALFRARCPLLGGVTMKWSSSGGESMSCALRSSGLISVTEDTQTWIQDRQGHNRCFQ